MDIPIHSVCGQKVILDSDLAKLYEVTTKRLNEQVKRNERKFPRSFRFQLTEEQYEVLRSQNATSNKGRGGRRYMPYVFTEHGALQAANVLRSEKADAMSVYIINAFVQMRKELAISPEVLRRLRTRSTKNVLEADSTLEAGAPPYRSARSPQGEDGRPHIGFNP